MTVVELLGESDFFATLAMTVVELLGESDFFATLAMTVRSGLPRRPSDSSQ